MNGGVPTVYKHLVILICSFRIDSLGLFRGFIFDFLVWLSSRSSFVIPQCICNYGPVRHGRFDEFLSEADGAALKAFRAVSTDFIGNF